MAIFNNSIIPAAAAAAADDVVTKSLRFNRADDPYISFTPSSTGDQKKWTNAMWIKRSSVGLSTATYFGLTCDMHSGEHNNGVAGIYFGSGDDKLDTYFDTSGANPAGAINDRVYRDPASWMQIIWAVDAANTTQRIWVNGVEETVTSSNDPPDYAYAMNKSGHLMAIGTSAWGVGNCFDGYIAQVVHLDGQYITDPTEFGQVDATSGEWTPKELTSSSFTYGTNGVLLEFLQTGTSADSSGIGADTSGNDNHWSVTNLASTDIVADNPSAGSNYCTLNPLDTGGAAVLSEGNLAFSKSGSNFGTCRGTIGMTSGKWYFEGTRNSDTSLSNIGIMGDYDITYNSGDVAPQKGVTWDSRGNYYTDASSTSASSYSTGDTICVAFDADTKKVWFRNGSGSWEGGGDPAAGTTPSYTITTSSSAWFAGVLAETDGGWSALDFGQSGFAQTPPTGFSALSTGNLPAPTIAKPSEHFSTTLYSGNSGTQSITTGLEPDLLWIKNRGASSMYHQLFDSVRGLSAGALVSNNTDTEDSVARIASLDSTGFTTSSTDYSYTNSTSNTYVAWSWKAGTSFDAGGGSGTGSKNVDAGFSIAKWTGDDDGMDLSGYPVPQAITHGLTVTPEMIIVKNRTANSSTSGNWAVYHKDLTSGTYLALNSTGMESSWGTGTGEALFSSIGATTVSVSNDAYTSSIYLNYADNTGGYGSDDTYIGYFFASKTGFSKCGTWVGTGVSSTGPFIYTGFRPAWVMHVEKDTGSYNWVIHDSARDPNNDDSWNHLIADGSDTENGSNTGGPDYFADFLSNGFKLRSVSTEHGNGSGKTYIYIAFAESPFKYANAR